LHYPMLPNRRAPEGGGSERGDVVQNHRSTGASPVGAAMQTYLGPLTCYENLATQKSTEINGR